MLNNPAEIEVRTKSKDETDNKVYVGRVWAYGFNTEEMEGMVGYLSGRERVISVGIK